MCYVICCLLNIKSIVITFILLADLYIRKRTAHILPFMTLHPGSGVLRAVDDEEGRGDRSPLAEGVSGGIVNEIVLRE